MIGMEYLKVWVSFREIISPLDDAEKGRLFDAMLLYANDGTEPVFSGNWCVAGCREPYKAGATMREYVNAGVLFWNLEKMRDGHAARLIKAINEKAYMYVEQDAIAEQLDGTILRIDGGYNSCAFVEPAQTGERVKHYAARGWGAFMADGLVKEYLGMAWP